MFVKCLIFFCCIVGSWKMLMVTKTRWRIHRKGKVKHAVTEKMPLILQCFNLPLDWSPIRKRLSGIFGLMKELLNCSPSQECVGCRREGVSFTLKFKSILFLYSQTTDSLVLKNPQLLCMIVSCTYYESSYDWPFVVHKARHWVHFWKVIKI